MWRRALPANLPLVPLASEEELGESPLWSVLAVFCALAILLILPAASLLLAIMVVARAVNILQ